MANYHKYKKDCAELAADERFADYKHLLAGAEHAKSDLARGYILGEAREKIRAGEQDEFLVDELIGILDTFVAIGSAALAWRAADGLCIRTAKPTR